MRRAVDVQAEYDLQFYDAPIVATADKLGCHEIVGEDFAADRFYRGMDVVNPFA